MNINKIFKDKKTLAILFLVLILGILMMLWKTPEKTYIDSNTQIENNNTEEKLENILSNVKGAGNVKVMINYKTNGEKIFAYNTDKQSESDDNKLTNNEKSEIAISDNSPVILKEYTPEIEGVLIVAQGGGNQNVKNNLTRATMALLGIDMNKIEVLVMKKEA